MRLILVLLACLAFDGPSGLPAPSQRAPDLPALLVRSAWENVSATGTARETTTYQFFTNGSFERHFASDHVDERWGAWRVKPVDAGGEVLLLAETSDAPPETAPLTFLPIQQLDHELQIGELRFHEVPVRARASPPKLAGGEPLEILQSVADSLTTGAWRHSGPGGPGDPDQLAFTSGGTFQARFDTAPCSYGGRFSFSWRAEGEGELRLQVPANQCGGFAEAHVRVQPFHFDSENLVIHKTVYRRVTPREMER